MDSDPGEYGFWWRQRRLLVQYVVIAVITVGLVYGLFYAFGRGDLTAGGNVWFAFALLLGAIVGTWVSTRISTWRHDRWDHAGRR